MVSGAGPTIGQPSRRARRLRLLHRLDRTGREVAQPGGRAAGRRLAGAGRQERDARCWATPTWTRPPRARCGPASPPRASCASRSSDCACTRSSPTTSSLGSSRASEAMRLGAGPRVGRPTWAPWSARPAGDRHRPRRGRRRQGRQGPRRRPRPARHRAALLRAHHPRRRDAGDGVLAARRPSVRSSRSTASSDDEAVALRQRHADTASTPRSGPGTSRRGRAGRAADQRPAPSTSTRGTPPRGAASAAPMGGMRELRARAAGTAPRASASTPSPERHRPARSSASPRPSGWRRAVRPRSSTVDPRCR